MEGKEITSYELNKQVRRTTNKAIESIISIMKKHHTMKVDFTLDDKGRKYGDSDYDPDWVYENRVYVTCYYKEFSYEGYVTEIILNNDKLFIQAENEDDTYDNNHILCDVNTYIDILSQLEIMQMLNIIK